MGNRGYCMSGSPAWSRAVRTLRVLAPLGFVAAMLLAILAYRGGHCFSLAVDSACAGVNAILTWFEWRVLKP